MPTSDGLRRQTSPARRLERRVARIRLVHPFPSGLLALIVGALAAIAGAQPLVAARLGLAMLAIQFAIGTANDVVDASSDALGQPWKAIPAGYVSKRTAAVMAGLLAMVGLCLSALAGPAALIVGAAGLGLGMAYDLRLKLTPLAWLVYALALPLVPAYAWLGARKQLPPRFRVLAPMAFLAGGVLAIGNATADVGPDDLAGRPTAAGRLEGRAATVIVAAGTAIVFTAAAATFGRSGTARATRLGLAIGAAACGLGILSSTRPTTSLRRLGWACQTLGFAALAAGWLAGQAQD